MKRSQEKWIAIGLPVGLVALLAITVTSFSIRVLEDYGLVLFTLVPLGMGIVSSVSYGYFRPRTWKQSFKVSALSLLIACMLLLLLSIEGLLCLMMASPILLLFNLIGVTIGYFLQSSNKKQTLKAFTINFLLLPILMTTESQILNQDGGMIGVKTAVLIEAPIAAVWKNVVLFPDIPEPEEWIFKSGLAYPISSRIEGEREHAVRYCEFTTGAFVEPITVWNEPYHLKFNVEEQPVPLRKLLTDEVPANMYKYFVSTEGEFRLKEIGSNQTLLEGTTWYYHKIRPVAYWKIWSDYIIHSIHLRVLNHIKKVAEAEGEYKE